MLVLARKINQSILIGNDIRISVLSIDGERVSLGVDAPRDIRVFRSELLEDTKNLNRASAGSMVIPTKDIK